MARRAAPSSVMVIPPSGTWGIAVSEEENPNVMVAWPVLAIANENVPSVGPAGVSPVISKMPLPERVRKEEFWLTTLMDIKSKV